MIDYPIVRVVTARESGDCAICVLAMLSGKTYEDVLAVGARHINSRIHHAGMYGKEIVRVAKELGITLRWTRHVDLETALGILSVSFEEGPGHVLLINSGLLIDVDGTIWEPDVYVNVKKAKVERLYYVP